MTEIEKTALQKIEPKLTGEELINLGNYINVKQKEAQKDLLLKLNNDSCCPEELGEKVQDWMKLNL